MAFFESGYVQAGYEGASDTGVEYENLLSVDYTVTTTLPQTILSVVWGIYPITQKLLSVYYKFGDYVYEDILSVNYSHTDEWVINEVSINYDVPVPIFESSMLPVNYNLGEEATPLIRIIRKDEND